MKVRIVNDMLPVLNRQCGDCSLCCKVIAVTELNKHAGEWCKHVKPNKQGCTVYDMRPESCQGFQCGWLLGWIPDEYSPRKARVVFMGDDDERVLTVFEDPKGPSPTDEPKLKKVLSEMLLKGSVLVIVRGEQRRVVGDADIIRDVLTKRGATNELIDQVIKEGWG
jgi:hypothetical protein